MKNTTKVVSILSLALIGGCASQDELSIVSDVDDATGVSLARPRQPARLAAERPGLSAVGKDYLFTGPVSVSGSGTSQTYLWFATASTIDRHITGAPEPTFKTIILVVDGTQMTFDLIPWASASKAAPYELPMEPRASYAAKVTSSQIQQIATATTLQAYVTDNDSRSPTYYLAEAELRDWLSF